MDHDAQSAPQLVVESGLHRSASCAIIMGDTRVGAGLDNEISVSDLGSPVGFELRRTGAGLLLRAVDPTLNIDGKPLRPGGERFCTKTLSFKSGGIRFRLDIPATSRGGAVPRPKHRFRSHVCAFAGGAACIAILTVTLSLHAAAIPGFPNVSSDTREPAVQSSALPRSNAQKPSAATLLYSLRQQVAAARLETIELRARPDGSIAAAGTIASGQDAAWHEIGRWFDETARGRFVLVDGVKTTSEAPALQIQAVWPGRNPYVVDGGGQKLFVGSMMTSGWVINSIDRSRVLIKRGEQVVAVRF